MAKVPGRDLIDPARNQFEFMYNKVLEAQATADEYKGQWERVEELNRLLVEQSDRRLELLREAKEAIHNLSEELIQKVGLNEIAIDAIVDIEERLAKELEE